MADELGPLTLYEQTIVGGVLALVPPEISTRAMQLLAEKSGIDLKELAEDLSQAMQKLQDAASIQTGKIKLN